MLESFEKGRHYRRARWRRVRAIHLSRQPLCCICEAMGKIKAADHVDHINPISKGGAPYDLDNLRSLCINHHSEVTAKEQKLGAAASDKPLKGWTPDGMPIDPNHPWNLKGGADQS